MELSSEDFEACKAGDARAWRSFFDCYAARVHRWVVLRGVVGPEAEDTAQDVLLTAHRKIGSCGSRGQLTSWLYQITRRHVANKRRLAWFRRVRPTERLPDQAFTGVERELELGVRACLDTLPDAQREVLVLCEIEGHSRRQIAALTGLPEGTVASRLRLAKKAFARAWTAPQGGVLELP